MTEFTIGTEKFRVGMKEFRIGGVSIKWLGHSSFIIEYTKKIYIDPFKINEQKNDADIVLISHEHYDHFSPDDLRKVINENTAIILTPDCLSKLSRFVNEGKTYMVRPGEKMKIGEKIILEILPAYNINKFKAPGLPFHPKANEWVGYVINFDSIRIYFAGDTDFVPELRDLKVDVAIVPVSGTYVMTADEAADFVNSTHPKYAIPMHYGDFIGNQSNAERFKSLAKSEVIILEKS